MKPILAKAALIASGLLVGAAIAEAVLALALPGRITSMSGIKPFFGKFDPEIGWVLKENVRGMHQPNALVPPVEVAINSQGLRGPLVPYERTPGARRILVTGDSNTFGYGLDAARAYPALLQAALGPGYEVINAGFIGYGTDQQYLFLRREGMKYRPDVVIVGFSGGDIYDNMCSMRFGTYKPYFTLDPAGGLRLMNTPVPMRVPLREVFGVNPMRDALLKRSRLYGLLYRALYKPDALLAKSIEAMDYVQGGRVTAEIVRKVMDLCAGQGCSVLFLALPQEDWIAPASQADDSAAHAHKAALDALVAAGARYIDLWGPFVSHRGEGLYLPGDPIHLSTRGNEVVAQSILSKLGAGLP